VLFDSVKLGRNELCPCDSGKKYKKCCLINAKYEEGEESPQDRAATLLGRKRLLEKLKHNDVIFSPPIDSMPKISAAILELAKDMLDSARNKSQRKIAIMTACTAWNMSVVAPLDLFDEKMNIFFEMNDSDAEGQMLIKQIISSMIEKKNLLYPDDLRVVVDFEIVDTKTFFSVNVAAMLPAELFNEESDPKNRKL
jgi:hypothetical protein